MGEVYVAPKYKSTLTAERLNRVRISNNEIILPLNNYQWEGYYFGLLFIPAVFFGLILVWLASVVAASWCKRTVEDNRLGGFVVFFILAVASFFCWVPVFVANMRTNDSIDDIIVSIHDLSLYFINVGEVTSRTSEIFDTILDDDRAIRICLDALSAQLANTPIPPFPLEDLQALVDKASDVLADVFTLTSGTAAALETGADALDFVETSRDEVTNGIAIFAMVLTFFLCCIAVYGFLIKKAEPRPKEPHQFDPYYFNKPSSATCITLYTCAGLCLAIGWLICSAYYLGSAVSADICVPSPEEVVQRVLMQPGNSMMLNPDNSCIEDIGLTTRFVLANQKEPNLQFAPVAETARIACYYQTCQGNSELAELLAQVAATEEEIEEKTTEFIDGAQESFDNATDPVIRNLTGTCIEAAVGVAAIVLLADGPVQQIVELIQCQRLNEIYVKFMHQAVCRDFVDNTQMLWASIIASSTLLMLALLVHRIFRLELPRNYFAVEKAPPQIIHRSTESIALT